MSTASIGAPLQPSVDSPLLMKARNLGLRLPDDLERLAIARGCTYYDRDLGPRVPPLQDVPFSNAELAIALIAPALPPTARDIRLAAALLGTTGILADQVAALSRSEGCADILKYIAECGCRYEPDSPFWSAITSSLADVTVEAKQLPHPTRFVEMTGMDRGQIRVTTKWVRPRVPQMR